MERTRNDFIELSKAKIQEKRNLVISRKASNNTYTLGQQVVVQEGRRQTVLFIKGAIQIDNLEGLYNLRDALNEAINLEEDEKSFKKT